MTTAEHIARAEDLRQRTRAGGDPERHAEEAARAFRESEAHYSRRMAHWAECADLYEPAEHERLLALDGILREVCFELRDLLSGREGSGLEEVSKVCATYELIDRIDNGPLPEWLCDLAIKAREDFKSGLCEEWP